MRRSLRRERSVAAGGSVLLAAAGSLDRAVLSDAIGVFLGWTLEPEKPVSLARRPLSQKVGRAAKQNILTFPTSDYLRRKTSLFLDG
jgi:hypothetical protein